MPRFGPTRLLLAACSHPGAARHYDEAFLVTDLATGDRHGPASFAVEIEGTAGFGLAVVDAMGGFRWGQSGGELVADALHAALTAPPRAGPGEDPRARLAAAMSAADRAIVAEVARDRRRVGLGASATIGVVSGDAVHLAHLGATRAYLFRDGNLRRLTRDHTIGESPGVDRRPYYPPNVITAALGYRATVRETDHVPPVALRRGDVLLLCTAGLHEPVAHACCSCVNADPG